MWKSRIYGFLFRRILGPYLTAASQQRLTKSLNVSLSEGKLELNNVELDGRSPALLSKIDVKFHDTVKIERIHVQRLRVVLSLLYFNEKGEVVKEYESGKAKLIAHVELDGVDVHVNVNADAKGNAKTCKEQQTEKRKRSSSSDECVGDGDGDVEDEDMTSSLSSLRSTSRAIRSYVQGALDSLKLSLNINDVTIRVSPPDATWVTLNVATISYRDSEQEQTSSATAKDLGGLLEDNSTVTVLEKEIGVDTVTITVGETLSTMACTNLSEEVMRIEGKTSIQMMVKSSPIMCKKKGSKQKLKLERNCILTMDQEIVLNASIDTLERMQRIMTEISCISDDDVDVSADIEDKAWTSDDEVEVEEQIHETNSNQPPSDSDSMDSDRDLEFLTNIIEQRTDEKYMDNLNSVRNRAVGNDEGGENGDNDNGLKQKLSHNDDALSASASEFFDTNEGGYSYYCNVLESSINEDEHANENVDSVSTGFQINLRQASLKLHLQPSHGGRDGAEACLYLDLQGLSVSSKKTNLHQNIHFEIVGLACEHSRLLTYADADEVSSILQFETEDNDVSPPPVLSLNIDVRETDDGARHSDIQVAMKPISITYNQRIIADLQKGFSGLSHEKSDAASSQQELSSNSISCQMSCDQINVFVPIEAVGEMDEKTLSSVSNALVQRSGYQVIVHGPLPTPNLAFEISEFLFDFAKGKPQDQEEEMYEDVRVAVLFQRSVLSFIVPIQGEVTMKRFDFVAFESETRIDPDAIIKIEYSNSLLSQKSDAFKKERAKRNFPIVAPLASVKASQNFEKKEPGDDSIGHVDSDVFTSGKKRLRGADPQLTMLKDLVVCEQTIFIHIPSLAIDLSVIEKDAISHLLSCIPQSTSDTDTDEQTQKMSGPNINMSLRCDQLSTTMHQNNMGETIEEELFSYTLVCDGFKSHILFYKGELKNTRLVCNDLTLFEVQDQSPSNSSDGDVHKQTAKQICESIRKRRGEWAETMTPIFFRSKLSQCLSPTTPAINLDLIMQRDEYHIERAIHVSIYDMTYRYDCESKWLSRIQDLLKANESFEQRTTVHDDITTQSEEMAIVNNIFATLSDCNVDYTSPVSFITPSRTVLRFGEVRFTSNIIIPSGPAQVFKISLADVAVHISNKRVGHDVENSRLSCASIFQNTISTSDVMPKSIPHSLDDALLRMDFIRVASLDFFESTITKVDGTIDQDAADSTALCSIGRVCIYACRDSFVCFTETINELVVKLTMPTFDELEMLRKDFYSKKQHSLSQKKEKRELPIDEESSYLIQNPTPLSDVMENSLFASMEPEEDVEIEEEREENRTLIDDFFSADRKPTFDRAGENTFEDNANDDDWTSIQHSWANDQSIPENEEQAARWYPSCDVENSSPTTSLLLPKETKIIIDGESTRQPRIFSHHVPIEPVSHPSAEGDMGAARFVGSTKPLKVTFRLLVQDMCLDCRFFDGFDWPSDQARMKEGSNNELMNDLLGNNDGDADIFADTDRKVQSVSTPSRLIHSFFQFSFKGLNLRLDSFADSLDHTLSSCMDLSLSDMYLIETISSRGNVPVKLLGEWVNDDHTRDSNDGLMTMKLFSMPPDEMFSSDGKLMGNEGRATLEFLPIRFLIHQVALRFIRGFFRYEAGNVRDPLDNTVTPPEMFFPVFRVKAFNIKVDYKPKTVNTSALKDGSLVELLNVLPLEDMILRLSEVEMRNLTGWGSIISELACNWLADVSSTQMHKFLTRTTPLHPFATVGDGMKQFLMIPLEEYKQKGNVKRGFRKGTKKLASVLAYETLSVGARLTGLAAKALGRRKSKNTTRMNGHMNMPSTSQNIPSLPRSMDEVSDHALESLARGLKEANAKIIIIPYREFQKSGTRGAVKCVVKGLPVAVCAPLSGAAEAAENLLYGVRNQLRPDLLEEEEASKRLHNCDIQF